MSLHRSRFLLGPHARLELTVWPGVPRNERLRFESVAEAVALLRRFTREQAGLAALRAVIGRGSGGAFRVPLSDAQLVALAAQRLVTGALLAAVTPLDPLFGRDLEGKESQPEPPLGPRVLREEEAPKKNEWVGDEDVVEPPLWEGDEDVDEPPVWVGTAVVSPPTLPPSL